MKKLRNLKNENGVVAIFVALAFVALIGIVAYVVDTGSLYQSRRSIQKQLMHPHLQAHKSSPATLITPCRLLFPMQDYMARL